MKKVLSLSGPYWLPQPIAQRYPIPPFPAALRPRPNAESTRPERFPTVSVVIPTRRILQPEHDVVAIGAAATAVIVTIHGHLQVDAGLWQENVRTQDREGDEKHLSLDK
ncbi:hypothetical protein BDV24DRAFT_161607 [Aspergillus arachidicola]|uniref:Uncharacterized protein n=1 Tax=Aspergillus arachidicola TaxID=656916 RepID=A0A5N6YFC9_9EURO|nr:hypothetical protein BDV24DRAFT_161607 [Aspergillus arachidicola]